MCTKSIYKENTPVHSQTCIKRSPPGQRKTGLIRGSIHIQFSTTGQENGDLLIQVTACAGLILSEYLYLNPWSTALKVSTLAITPMFTKRKFKKVTAINSTNINKTNNHLSSQLNLLNIKKTMTYDVGNPVPGLGQAQNTCNSYLSKV
jgi:hypothetical protein